MEELSFESELCAQFLFEQMSDDATVVRRVVSEERRPFLGATRLSTPRALACYAALVADLGQFAPDSVRPISRAEYEKMVELDMFADERVELLYGIIVTMTPTKPPHDGALQRLNRLLVLALDPHAAVRIQSSFAASDGSEPEPDVAIVPPGDYDDAHPSEAWLIVEVAETSLAKDRTVKARLYAGSGVQEYWIVNLVDGLIEVHTDIVNGAYARVAPYRKGEAITVQKFPDVKIAVADVLR